jgi:hypothetical protein
MRKGQRYCSTKCRVAAHRAAKVRALMDQALRGSVSA